MSRNPGMEQDFRDMITRFNQLVILARRGVVEAHLGDKEGVTVTLTEMAGKTGDISDTVQTLRRCLDTFTDRRTQPVD